MTPHPVDASGTQVHSSRLVGGHPTPPIGERLAVFALILAIYVVMTPRPHGFYHHHVYMAKAFLAGRVHLVYFSTGWVQFGYRYSLDWWPFLLVVLAFTLDERPRAIDVALLAASIVMNGLGAYWVRVLG